MQGDSQADGEDFRTRDSIQTLIEDRGFRHCFGCELVTEI